MPSEPRAARYHHSAPGFATGIAVAAGSAILVSVFRSLNAKAAPGSSASRWVMLAPGIAVLGAALVVFFRLRIDVGGGTVAWSFGPGLFGGRLRMADIVSTSIVRSPWYHGWGVRLTPAGRLYNVTGFSAVELTVRRGQAIRLGTNDPEGLLAAIEAERDLERFVPLRLSKQ